MSMIEPRPLCPTSGTWERLGPCPFTNSLGWRHVLGGVVVTSAVETTDRGPEWHIAISGPGPRAPTFQEAAFVLQAFGAVDFEHDDHGARYIASYWKPVNRDLEGVCPCKDEELGGPKP